MNDDFAMRIGQLFVMFGGILLLVFVFALVSLLAFWLWITVSDSLICKVESLIYEHSKKRNDYLKWENMNWVSVDDRLPNEEGYHIVAMNLIPGRSESAVMDIVYYCDWIKQWRTLKGDVTHWMPAPKLPYKN